MAPVARELSIDRGVLEPLQTARSLEGQLDELRSILTANGDPPFTLIGSSWGAMLSYMLAARCPEIVRKLILVGSGVDQEAMWQPFRTPDSADSLSRNGKKSVRW